VGGNVGGNVDGNVDEDVGGNVDMHPFRIKVWIVRG
jgi:hypothetical protein